MDVPRCGCQLKSYVWHHSQCFFVSTIERQSSGAAYPPPWYAETLAWEYDWGNQLLGSMIAQVHDGSAFEQHVSVARKLYESGECSNE